MALPSKPSIKVNIQLKELQEACDNAPLKLGKMTGIFKKKQLDSEDLGKAIDHLMENPDTLQMAVKASKSAPKFFSTALNKPSIVPGSVVITSENGELVKVDSVDYKTGSVTLIVPYNLSEVEFGMDFGHDPAAPEEPYTVEICSADLQYTPEVEGRWLHPDIKVLQDLKDSTYRAYCPHCCHYWKVDIYTLLDFSDDYHKDTHQLHGEAPLDEVMAAYIVWKTLKPCA